MAKKNRDDLRARYPKKKTERCVTLAVREDIIGGNTLVELITLVHERSRSKSCTQGERLIIDLVYNEIDAAYAMARNVIHLRYDIETVDVSHKRPDDVPPMSKSQASGRSWMRPIWSAWVILARLDYREMDSKTLDFACEIKSWLQTILDTK